MMMVKTFTQHAYTQCAYPTNAIMELKLFLFMHEGGIIWSRTIDSGHFQEERGLSYARYAMNKQVRYETIVKVLFKIVDVHFQSLIMQNNRLTLLIVQQSIINIKFSDNNRFINHQLIHHKCICHCFIFNRVNDN